MEKKLYRSNDRKIFGVCGGLAEYFGINPLIVRILWIIFAVNTNGLGAVIYLVVAIHMANRPDYVSRYDN